MTYFGRLLRVVWITWLEWKVPSWFLFLTFSSSVASIISKKTELFLEGHDSTVPVVDMTCIHQLDFNIVASARRGELSQA